MTEKEKQLSIWLSQIADELNITPTMLDKAVKSYTAVGTWLSDGIPYNVKITPQGSMNLGRSASTGTSSPVLSLPLPLLRMRLLTMPVRRL